MLLLEPSRLAEPGREALSRFEGELRGAEIPVIRRELPELEDPSAALERESREQPSVFACTVDAQGSVVSRGGALFAVSGTAARLLYGAVPAYREFASALCAVPGVFAGGTAPPDCVDRVLFALEEAVGASAQIPRCRR